MLYGDRQTPTCGNVFNHYSKMPGTSSRRGSEQRTHPHYRRLMRQDIHEPARHVREVSLVAERRVRCEDLPAPARQHIGRGRRWYGFLSSPMDDLKGRQRSHRSVDEHCRVFAVSDRYTRANGATVKITVSTPALLEVRTAPLKKTGPRPIRMPIDAWSPPPKKNYGTFAKSQNAAKFLKRTVRIIHNYNLREEQTTTTTGQGS